jgi:hypothetical protein
LQEEIILTKFEKLLALIMEKPLKDRKTLLGDYSYMGEEEKKIIEEYLKYEEPSMVDCFQNIGKESTLNLMGMLNRIDADKINNNGFLSGIERGEELDLIIKLVRLYE